MEGPELDLLGSFRIYKVVLPAKIAKSLKNTFATFTESLKQEDNMDVSNAGY